MLVSRVMLSQDADEACSAAGGIGSFTTDACSAPDQSPSSQRELQRSFGSEAAAHGKCSRVQAAAPFKPASPAVLKQQLQLEADAILTEFRQALSYGHGAQQSNVVTGDAPMAQMQEWTLSAGHNVTSCAAVATMDETPTSWRGVGRTALESITRADGRQVDITPQSEAASCMGPHCTSVSGVGGLDSRCTALLRPVSTTTASGGFTDQPSANRYWRGIQRQQQGMLRQLQPQTQNSHYCAPRDQPPHAVAASAVVSLLPPGRLCGGWRAASAEAMAASSPALAPSVDLSRLLESPSPGGSTPQQQKPVSSRIGVLATTDKTNSGSSGCGFGFAPPDASDMPTPMGVSRELSFMPCSMAKSAATAATAAPATLLPGEGSTCTGHFSSISPQSATPVLITSVAAGQAMSKPGLRSERQGWQDPGALGQLQQQYTSPYPVKTGATCSLEQGMCAQPHDASPQAPLLGPEQQPASMLLPTADNAGLLLSPHALINDEMSWASWASEADLISRRLAPLAGGGGQLPVVARRGVSTSPAVSAAASSTLSNGSPLPPALSLPSCEVQHSARNGETGPGERGPSHSSACRELSLLQAAVLSGSQPGSDDEPDGDRKLSSPISTASSPSSLDSSLWHHHILSGAHGAGTLAGEAASPTSFCACMAWAGSTVEWQASGQQGEIEIDTPCRRQVVWIKGVGGDEEVGQASTVEWQASGQQGAVESFGMTWSHCRKHSAQKGK